MNRFQIDFFVKTDNISNNTYMLYIRFTYDFFKKNFLLCFCNSIPINN